MSKRKAEDPELDQTPSKKQAVEPKGSDLVRECFGKGLLEEKSIDEQAKKYAASTPYKYGVISGLIEPNLLSNVRSEIQDKLAFTPKETDIYKIHQSGDLANLDGLDDAALQQLPSLRRLRDALYSHQFRDCLCKITGSKSVSGKKTDMAINVYTPGCHLLCHDDVIGSRRISYILYLTDPEQPWQKDWGGALRLYPTEELPGEGDAKILVPKADPSVSIPPAFNQLSFFAVQPGQSFHDVEEVYGNAKPDAGKGPDEHRVRMAISGWYHVPQEGEEGFRKGEETELANKSSLAQLQASGDVHDRPKPNIVPYPVSTMSATEDKATSKPDTEEQDPKHDMEDEVLSEEDLNFLLKYIAPSYLTPDTLESVSSTFGDECSIVLDHFLSRKFAESLQSLGVLDVSTAPPAALEAPDSWQTARPPHKHRYWYQRAQDSSVPTTPLQDLTKNLIPSPAFRKWLQLATGYIVRSHDVLARRFRRGYDYTLAQSYNLDEPRLEVCLCLTPSGIEMSDPSPQTPAHKDHKGAVEDQSQPTIQDPPKPTIGDPPKPTIGDPPKPTIGDPPKPTIGDPPKPTIGDPPKPTIGDPPKPTIADPPKPAVKGTSPPTTEQASLPASKVPTQSKTEDFSQPDATIISPPTTENPSQSTQESKPDASFTSTEASTAPEPDPKPDPDPEHGGYLAYMASDDAPDDASDSVEVPTDLSTGGRATKAKADPAIYQTAKDDEDDGVLFSMPSCWNKLGIVLRDRGTMRFVKYLSKAAPSDRWDIFGEFEIDPPEDEGDGHEEEEDEGKEKEKDEEEATTVHDEDDDDDDEESEETDSSDD